MIELVYIYFICCMINAVVLNMLSRADESILKRHSNPSVYLFVLLGPIITFILALVVMRRTAYLIVVCVRMLLTKLIKTLERRTL